MCIMTGCRKPTSQYSRKGYCTLHAKEAKTAWIAMIAAKSAKTQPVAQKQTNYAAILQEALQAGQVAFDAAKCVPMVVQQHKTMFDDDSPVVKQWIVPGGECGFASVHIRPATGSFARWLRETKQGRTSDYGGMYLRASPQARGPEIQSYTRQCAWASAICTVLDKYGVPCQVESRVD